MELSTPGVKTKNDEDRDTALEGYAASLYRGLVARASVVAADRPDIRFAAKDRAKDMSQPKKSSWNVLERVGK